MNSVSHNESYRPKNTRESLLQRAQKSLQSLSFKRKLEDKELDELLLNAKKSVERKRRALLNTGFRAPSGNTTTKILETAYARRDAERLRNYAQFPELCDWRYKNFFHVLNNANRVVAIPLGITEKTVRDYKLAGEAFDGSDDAMDPDYPMIVNHSRTLVNKREALQSYVLQNPDNSEYVLQVVTERRLLTPEDIEKVIALGKAAPALRDGVL